MTILALVAMWICLLIIAVAVIMLLVVYILYRRTSYYQITRLSLFSVWINKGLYGEYRLYKMLRKYEKLGARFLFNLYVPTQNGKTTEIDVLMITSKGLIVFESKNYSGWIYGSEHQSHWVQVLGGGLHKARFYNPIMQNLSHVKHLKNTVGMHVPMWSAIVFSNRCTLMDVQTHSSNVTVINRTDVARLVQSIWEHITEDRLDAKELSAIYNTLYPFSQVDEKIKEQHVANMKAMSDKIHNYRRRKGGRH